MKLSVVGTLYYSEKYIEEFCSRVSRESRSLFGDDYEIILVNDGSPDNSLNIAKEAAKKDCHIKVVDLSKNFGHYKAIMTGLEFAEGDLVFLLDTDLEEQPEWLSVFYERMRETASDVIYGVQGERKGGLFEKVSGKFFYKLFNFLSKVKIPENSVTARLMTSSYKKSLLQFKEQELFLFGVFELAGFKQLPYTVKKLQASPTTYSLSRKFSIFFNGLTSFSAYPLKMIFLFGFSISLISFLYFLFILFNWFMYEKPIQGWTSIILSIWFFGGIITLSIGVIGIYLSKIFIEVKNRPYTIVKSFYRVDEK
ncbi:glycosyltransferase family 2 protein [Thiomicrorhabdus sp. zzn3]|uniref:glycosyltransferase family 2 protein n=1 Tax=Thiomicrorhabdus sp. zzn3 TaxID=3039775 RepID=UPI002436BD49|nr:glycosyltransferase family 2 protein [Thiomicrorhabdus sp. zzn3]MDG6777363.1 glycosyltransferase family 2 protein [Thiomicrorhabdus sp. zzn3]